MQHYNIFESLLFRFCQQHQVAMIQPDANLCYVLYVDNIEVHCFSNAGNIYLQVELMEAPLSPVALTQVYQHLMQQSLLDTIHATSVLSLNERGRATLFQRLVMEDCQLHDFEAAMALLANQVEIYSDILENHTSQ
ncbi:CesT family type III secretion system chaperone [Hahella ganghwensis]|uniref:CesT family type III secretion system chaperone n=1 Tax=Hahella ganghwensis TaxID=286420 RepID=UPI000369C71A|nr:CesT family type III secretion system chaperone [Hahella ganghwensis]